jgi:hypothetical protein
MSEEKTQRRLIPNLDTQESRDFWDSVRRAAKDAPRLMLRPVCGECGRTLPLATKEGNHAQPHRE